jgi:preprotein translocase subunit SecF
MHIKRVLENTMQYRYVFTYVSGLFLLISIALISFRGLNLGLDFTGGIQLRVVIKDDKATVGNILNALREGKYKSSKVQQAENMSEFLITIPSNGENPTSKTETSEIVDFMQSKFNNSVKLKQSNYIGSQVGGELRDKSGVGFIVAMLCMMLYLVVRFQYKFSLGAVGALAHDVVIVLGALSITQTEFNLSTLAAILAIVGYSVNDTIVVFDRVREGFHKFEKESSAHIISRSIYSTFSRTIITSLTTLLVIVSILIFGGENLYPFAFTLLIGILVGTYSSIFVAPNITLFLNIERSDLVAEENDNKTI